MIYLLKLSITKILINHSSMKRNSITLIWNITSEVEIEKSVLVELRVQYATCNKIKSNFHLLLIL